MRVWILALLFVYPPLLAAIVVVFALRLARA
jgi:hypothetical protein